MQPQYTTRRRSAEPTVIITGPAEMTVRRGRLVITDGFGCLETRRSTEYTPPLHLSGVVRIGKGGMWSEHALCLLAENEVPFYSLTQTGELSYSLLPPGGAFKPSLVRLQARLQEMPLGLELARRFITEKVSGQQDTLSWLRGQAALPGLIEERRPHGRDLELIGAAATLDELRLVEARAADSYFSRWFDLPVRFERTARGCVEVPAHWRTWPGRSSGKNGGNRDASDPINALLNFGYAVAAAEVMVACRAAALEPSLGILHADRDGRASLVYDLLEPLRPQVDQHLLQIATRRTFALRRDFILPGEGVCRLGIQLAAEVGKSIADLTRPLAGEVVSAFRKRLQEYVKSEEARASRGTLAARSAAPFSPGGLPPLADLPLLQPRVTSGPMVGGGRLYPQPASEQPQLAASGPATLSKGRQCARCSIPVPRRQKYCASCLHLRRREVALQNNERLWAKRHAEGDPSHGGDASRKRSETLTRKRAPIAA